MNRSDHHEWVKEAADKLIVSGDFLWQALCAEWAKDCATQNELISIAQPIQEKLDAKI